MFALLSKIFFHLFLCFFPNTQVSLSMMKHQHKGPSEVYQAAEDKMCFWVLGIEFLLESEESFYFFEVWNAKQNMWNSSFVGLEANVFLSRESIAW